MLTPMHLPNPANEPAPVWVETHTTVLGETVSVYCEEICLKAGVLGFTYRLSREPLGESDRAALWREFDAIRKGVV